jgi:predicted membrane protein
VIVADNFNVNPNRWRSTFTIRRGRGIFVGLFLLALGVVLLLDQQGVVSAHRVFQFFWPAFLIFFGLENISCRSNTSRIFGFALVSIGAFMLLGALGYVPFHIGFATIWPILMIAIGLALVATRITGGRMIGIGVHTRESLDDTFARAGVRPPANDIDSSFDYFAVLAGVKQKIMTKNFKGGRIVAAWGGFELDMRQADIEGESATIHVTAVMGGGSIRVPDNWIVDFQGTPFMGGLVDEREHAPAPDAGPAKRLIIRGLVFMGGVVIKNGNEMGGTRTNRTQAN